MGAAVSVIAPRPICNPFPETDEPKSRPPCPKPPLRPSPSQIQRGDFPYPNRIGSPQPMYGMLSSPTGTKHLEDPFERHQSPTLSSRPSSPFREPVPEAVLSSISNFSVEIETPGNPERAPPPDAIPNLDDGQDMAFDDEGLSTLEKIYLYARSKAPFHRVYIAHSLTSFLPDVSPLEAVEYVLPLLNGLAMDEEDSVKEALACELVPIMWWFISSCRVIDSDPPTDGDPCIPVTAFTPILGTLLLSPSRTVGGPARSAVVDILARIQLGDANADRGLFGPAEMKLLEQELLYQVVIGMGRLDIEGDEDDSDSEGDDRPEVWWTAPSTPADPSLFQNQKVIEAMNFNPYFPALPSVPEESPSPPPSFSGLSPASSASESITPRPNVSSTISQPSIVSPQSSVSPKSTGSSGSSLDLTPDLSPASQVSAASPTSPPEPISPVSNMSLSLPHVREEIVVGPNSQSSDPWVSGITTQDLTDVGAGEIYLNEPNEEESKVGLVDLDEDPSSESEEPEIDAGEQAAVGRLSSMSLMAALSATCSLDEEVQTAFVKEVERVGRDRIYWVRREASFALGALAKVVPVEILISSLLPLYESLRVDEEWHVRHSALFALPAILSRLSPVQRRALALETILSLAKDPEPAVRSGVLEALGEVIYTFYGDKAGPPDQLLDLFLGRKQGDGRHRRRNSRDEAITPTKQLWSENFGQSSVLLEDDPARMLICAFSYPAVALTLGRERWSELRESYLSLAQDITPKVRKTLAASVGEMAKIVGPENAKRDLMPVWLSSIRFDDGDVRLKAAESLNALVDVLPKSERLLVVKDLQEAWATGRLRGWRERDVVAHSLDGLVESIGDQPVILRALLRLALQDDAAAVRTAAVSVVPLYFRTFSQRRELLDDIKQMATSSTFRQRNTYVACQEALLLTEDGASMVKNDDLWQTLFFLAKDNIVDVRIGVARLVGRVYEKFFRDSASLPRHVLDLVLLLRADPRPEVRCFAPEFPQSRPNPAGARRPSSEMNSTIFSRPPPPIFSYNHPM